MFCFVFKCMDYEIMFVANKRRLLNRQRQNYKLDNLTNIK